jgi:hypothetical protein
MTLAFLDFQDNQLIAAYTGPKGQAAHIACGLITAVSRSFPEVISALIERRQTVGVEVVHQTLTAFVFVGFERADDARSVLRAKRSCRYGQIAELAPCRLHPRGFEQPCSDGNGRDISQNYPMVFSALFWCAF